MIPAALFNRPYRRATSQGGCARSGRLIAQGAAALWALAAAVAPSAPARAANPQCTDLPNVVIGVGGSASVPLLKSVAVNLLKVPNPITLVYQSPGACFGITPYVDNKTITGTASYWDSTGTELKCDLPLTGYDPDFGMLGVAATACDGVTAIPSGIGEFFGPITSWSIIVNPQSTQQVISAEAAYLLYGFGAVEGQVSPWTVQSEVYGRTKTSAALIAIGTAFGVPAAKFQFGDGANKDVKTNGAMVTAVANSANPQAAIGFVSTENVDVDRSKVRTLAYQHYGQACGYLPDSSTTSFDKLNVRDGHYYLWSPYRFYTRIGLDGKPVGALTKRLLGYFDGSIPAPAELDLLDVVIDNGNLPLCAMNVTRSEDLGPLSSYDDPEPCGCYYEARTEGVSTCQACTANSDCTGSAKVCRYGYCEVR
jgi:hypothetical protein